MHGTFRDLHPQVYHPPRDLPGEGAEAEEVKRDGGPKSPLSGNRMTTRLTRAPPGETGSGTTSKTTSGLRNEDLSDGHEGHHRT